MEAGRSGLARSYRIQKTRGEKDRHKRSLLQRLFSKECLLVLDHAVMSYISGAGRVNALVRQGQERSRVDREKKRTRNAQGKEGLCQHPAKPPEHLEQTPQAPASDDG